LWFLLLCAGIGASFALLTGSSYAILQLVIVALAVGLLIWLTVVPWLNWRTTHYVFTTHRVLIRRGILKHVGRDIALARINDVGFSKTLWERIVDAGTITIESAGEQGQQVLADIPRSDDMQQLLNRLIEQDHDRRRRQNYPGPAGGYPGYGPGSYRPPG
jgi:uncharacterized membrane protein YdbT with pleckstrin-like domain